jgi:hypothetical protein
MIRLTRCWRSLPAEQHPQQDLRDLQEDQRHQQ